MMFQNNKKAQFMALIQAAFAIIILVTVVIVLDNFTEKFPPLNLMPAQLGLNLNENSQLAFDLEIELREAISKLGLDFLSANPDSPSHVSKKVPKTCFEQSGVILISKICQNYLKSTFEDSLSGAVIGMRFNLLWDSHLISKQDNLYVHAVSYAPIKGTYERATVIDKTRLDLFLDDKYGFQKMQDDAFDVLPLGAEDLSYRYSDKIVISFELSKEIQTVFEIDAKYDELQKDIATYLQAEKKNNSTDEWTTYLYSVTGVGAEEVQRVSLYDVELQNILERKYAFFTNQVYFLDITAESVIITFLDFPLRVEVQY